MQIIEWVKGRPVLAVFVAGYTVVFGALALRGGNIEFALYTGAMVIYIAVIYALDRRVGLTRLVLWLLAVWGLLHMAGGIVPIPEALTDGDKRVLYALRVSDWLPRYDQVVHAFGFFAATLLCGEAVAAALRGDIGSEAAPPAVREVPRWRPVSLSFGLTAGAVLMGMGLGAFNEVVEFAITRVMTEHGVGGYTNTGWDLVSNMAGAVFGGMVCWKGLGGRVGAR